MSFDRVIIGAWRIEEVVARQGGVFRRERLNILRLKDEILEFPSSAGPCCTAVQSHTEEMNKSSK